jgi:hypothetical protein
MMGSETRAGLKYTLGNLRRTASFLRAAETAIEKLLRDERVAVTSASDHPSTPAPQRPGQS